MRPRSLLPKTRGWLRENQVEFRQMLPLKLRNHVSGKNDRESQNACIQEMMNLFTCLKKNDYNQEPCSQEVDILNTCHKNHQLMARKEKELLKMGVLTPGLKKLNSHQTTMLLQKYPQK